MADIVEGSRVRLKRGDEEDGIPPGALGTVHRIYPGDDDKVYVIPDLRPTMQMLYLGYEVAAELEVVS